jgi:cysteine-rich repeat protein
VDAVAAINPLPSSAHSRRRPRPAIVYAVVVGFSLFAALTHPVQAQVESADRNCIAAFSKGLGKVAKAHGKIVKACTARFAAGTLVGQTPEECLASDPKGKLTKTGVKEVAKIAKKCEGGLPDFGVSTVNLAIGRAVLTQFGLVHGSIGPNLDENLIAIALDARCQSKVTAALLKCEEARHNEYAKCQKAGLKSGAITDAASLAAECLGTAFAPQPDPKGRIASKCAAKLLSTVATQCDQVDLTQAFVSCGAGDPAGVASCLSRGSACQLCRMLNDAGGVTRDCDAFDDGFDNGSCDAECGDGLVHPEESCDDGNAGDGDGCSDFCQVEGGWSCTGEPSVCTSNCGNGVLNIGETCDDGGTAGGDGCSSLCAVESSYTCTGQPSTCVLSCGNGDIQAGEGEVCDDDNQANGDGCSSSCLPEPGYICAGNPSVCTFVCGNSAFNAGETCDDGNAGPGDGCSALCQIETGWLCAGLPSICSPICGDGLKRSIEGCDDGDLNSGDGCSFLCQVETGFACAGEPSTCSAICGDGFIRGAENCDDGNIASGDGCSGTLCRNEFDHSCAGQPSVCDALCGNGLLDGIEECDDGNTANGDGCNGNCTTQAGYACFSTPSTCFPTCGNGVINTGETCDDGNSTGADGCGSSCKTESGWLCPTPGASCNKFDVFIDTPAHGIFTTATTAVITGHYTLLSAGQVAVTVNGVPASSLNTSARTFSHTVSLNSTAIFNPVLVSLTNTANGDSVRDRIVVIRGNSVADGTFSPQSVALRMNDRGLDSIEPLVGELAAGQFNLAQLMPPGTPVTSGCFIDSFLGCLGSADVRISSPAPSFGVLSIAFDSQINSVFGDINLSNLVVHAQINGSGLVPSCGLRLTASNLRLTGNYALQPDAADASNIDVNLVTPIGVAFSNFQHTFTSGLCDAPIIGDIINALLPDIQALTANGIVGFLEDPDGSGPQDSPIADAIEVVLAGISITGPVGEGVGLQLQSPLFAVTEDNSGITFGSNSRFQVSVGTGPGQCVPPLGAPDLTHSLAITSTFPTFGPNTPAPGNLPYGLGIAISTSGFNQLLRGQTECGLMRTSITEIDPDGAGPIAAVPINSTILSVLIPEFGQLPPFTPLRVDVAPSLAPVVTGQGGANGELTQLKIAQIEMEVVQPGPNTVWLAGAIDLPLGMNLAFKPDGTGLEITLTEPDANDLTIAIISNPLGANAADVEQNVLPGLIAPLVPDLAGALAGFPLPQFFGLQLDGVEVSRTGQFLALYADLSAAP